MRTELKRMAVQQGDDFPTPKTDKLIEAMLCGDGIPKCDEWDRLVEHAKEMERQAYANTAVAAALLRRSSTTTK